jgi:colanic acid/amylovoran biosynthesis glycosyltransferase
MQKINLACYIGNLKNTPIFIWNKIAELEKEEATVTLLCDQKEKKELARNKRIVLIKKNILYFPLVFLQAVIQKPKETVLLEKRLWKTKKNIKEFFIDSFKALQFLPMNFDIIHFEFGYPAFNYQNIFRAKDIIKPKIIVSFRGTDLNVAPLRGTIDYKLVFEHSDLLHFVSETLLEKARKLGYKKNNFFVNPSSIDTNLFLPNKKNKKKDKKIRIITVAALRWQKGHEFALSAIKKVIDNGIDTEFSIIGDGPYRQPIEYAIKQTGLEKKVFLKGQLSQKKVKKELQKADLFIQASVEEGFGNAPLEAMAMELPIIITKTGGLKNYIKNGENGFIVEKMDADAIAKKIEFIAQNRKLMQKIGKKARKTVLKNFTIEKQSKKFIKEYNKLLSQQK